MMIVVRWKYYLYVFECKEECGNCVLKCLFAVYVCLCVCVEVLRGVYSYYQQGKLYGKFYLPL